MIQMVMRVILASIVSDPLAVGVNMGSLRMPGLVGSGVVGLRRGVPSLNGSRSTLGNVSAAYFRLAATMFFLRENRESQRQRDCAQPDQYLHSTTLQKQLTSYPSGGPIRMPQQGEQCYQR
jgi:hypothetical protein